MTSSEALDHAMGLFREQNWKELGDFAGRWLEAHPEETEIWKLYGVALGSMGRGREARRAFLCALNLDPKDGSTALNYITSCLSSGDPKSALEAVGVYFSDMTVETRARMAESFMVAANQGVIDERDIPEVLRAEMSEVPPARPWRDPAEADRALVRAAAEGRTADVERAWEDGADLDVRDREGWPVLHLAIRGRHLQTADWLLQYGADPALKGPGDSSALELARQSGDPRFVRLLEGYFPKVTTIAWNPLSSWDTLLKEIYQQMAGVPSRGSRYPQPDGFEDLGAAGVSFGITRGDIAVDILPVVLEILGLRDWERRPENFETLAESVTDKVGLMTLEWIELSETPLAGPLDEIETQLLNVYTRNVDAIARIYLVNPKRLERLLGAIFYDDREEPFAIGSIPPARAKELFGDEMSFQGWDRMKTVLANLATDLNYEPDEE